MYISLPLDFVKDRGGNALVGGGGLQSYVIVRRIIIVALVIGFFCVKVHPSIHFYSTYGRTKE
jgi:hypothetical protein